MNETGADTELTVGQLAQRAGTTVSALRFYEDKGLIVARRTGGKQRRYRMSALHRVRIIRMAQGLGIPLAEIGEALSILPDNREPDEADWQAVSRHWESRIQARIDELTCLRDDPEGCIDAWLEAAEGGTGTSLVDPAKPPVGEWP